MAQHPPQNAPVGDKRRTAPVGKSNLKARYEADPSKTQPAAPKRRRVPKLEMLKRKQVVAAMMAAGVEDPIIKAELAKKFDTSPAIITRMMSAVIREWVETDVEQRPRKRLMAEKRLLASIAAAKAAKAWGAAASFERLLAEIQGTRQPDELHITVEAELRDSVAVVLTGLTPERINELAYVAQELRDKAAPQLVAPAPQVIDEQGNPVTPD